MMLAPVSRARTTLGNAVVSKELRTRLRGRRSIAIMGVSLVAPAIVAVGFLLQRAGSTAGQPSSVGVELFQALAAFQLVLILLITPISTAGAISGERQRQTWDLLLVTRLSSPGIVWGKLAGALAFNVLLLFASLPLFGLVHVLAGVASGDIIHVYVVFLGTVLLLGTASLLVSALTRRTAVAVIVSAGLVLVLSAGITMLAASLEHWGDQQYAPPGPQAPQLLPLPALTPLAQTDPLAALGSALPAADGGSYLGDLGTIHHAFGLPLTMQLWSVYAIIAAVASVLMLAVTASCVRRVPRGPGRSAG